MIWDDTSPETIVFELTNKEALKLLKGKLRQKQWDKIQQTPFCPFHGYLEQSSGQRAFSAGWCRAERSSLPLCSGDSFSCFPFQGVWCTHLAGGWCRGNYQERCQSAGRQRRLFITMKTVRRILTITGRRKNKHILTVEVDKFRAVFDLRKHLVPPWYKNGLWAARCTGVL